MGGWGQGMDNKEQAVSVEVGKEVVLNGVLHGSEPFRHATLVF